ncbi:hypothetical protein GCK32_006106, partial [Trichostrongylus colubriformis]
VQVITSIRAFSAGHYLFSGTSDGDLVAFDLRDEAIVKTPTFTKKVAKCAVSCVSLYDNEPPMMALCTGERVFPKPRISKSPSSESDSEDERAYRSGRHWELDNSLQLWEFESKPCT